MQQHNPYHNASNAYSSTTKTAGLNDPRSLEAHALLNAASKLDAIRSRMRNEETIPLEELSTDLDYNRKLWAVFADSAGDGDHELPLEIKNNIANLAMFMFKRTVEIMGDPEPGKFDVMIDINRQIASGLMQRPAKAEDENQAEPATTTEQESGTKATSPAPQAPSAPIDA
jgi:flagellar protein FlaF